MLQVIPSMLKPASQYSPAMGQAVCRIFLEAKLPPGSLIFFPGYGHGIGDLLVSHPDVALVAFTGSRLVGSRTSNSQQRRRPVPTAYVM